MLGDSVLRTAMDQWEQRAPGCCCRFLLRSCRTFGALWRLCGLLDPTFPLQASVLDPLSPMAGPRSTRHALHAPTTAP